MRETRVRLTKADICMNSKSEFHQPGIVRVIAVKGNVNAEQMEVFPLAGGGGGTRGRGNNSGRRGRTDGGGPGRSNRKF